LKHRFPGAIVNNDTLGKIISKIREAEDGQPLSEMKTVLGELEDINDYSKRFHHADVRAGGPVNDTELRSYVARALKLIR
jgi:hypothetical protein